MEYVFILLIVAVVVVLAWTWWSARSERDPASSVDTFSRALTAMQPTAAEERPTADAPSDEDAEAPATDDLTSR